MPLCQLGSCICLAGRQVSIIVVLGAILFMAEKLVVQKRCGVSDWMQTG